ncbi:MAG: VWA domain-containing protein [Flavobacteriales bacterium]|nr:VWA domain-containing protein [Flavobacteriales bacterium]
MCLVLSLPSFAQDEPKNDYKIQIALLLDVSGSMGGLVNQAKGQFWRMVNELSKVEKKGEKVTLQIALGSFGNSDFEENGFFKLHTPLTTDLDLLSEQLFILEIGGSEEYCGYAIQTALDSLDWSANEQDLKIIFIAGNESFSSGTVSYSNACKQASKRHIIINTIYCGTEQAGIDDLWADGAKRGKGKYLTISQDSAAKLTETLWDKKIIRYSAQLNGTYVPFGKDGEKLIKRQIRQDENALLLGNAFLRDRVMFKISKHYHNASWDLVDAYTQDSLILQKLEPDDFPVHLKAMTRTQKHTYLQQKQVERELYKEGAAVYCEKAKEHLAITTGITGLTLTLDNTIIDTIKEQGMNSGFEFK